MNLLFLALMGVCRWTGTFSYSAGNIAGACEDMMPLHTSFKPQATTAPFGITVSSTTYTPGDLITVTLKAVVNGTNFKGFMLQARKTGVTGAVGYFSSSSTTQFRLHNCSNTQSSAISHASGENKMRFESTWVAPSHHSLGNIEFCATFVEEYDAFWMVKSSPVLSTAGSAPVISKVSLSFMALSVLMVLGLVPEPFH
ncbi:putative ferric-chelate reductase 1 [Brachyhypopomus gauderio]|uniref:putative ferric-chelate reductase 1 n=1 Tax=Brachyhypopomus gauderio TaxID=698409 RepID=UPI004041BE22